MIVRALEASEGVQKHAAGLLRIKPTTLGEMIKRYGIQNRWKNRVDTKKVAATKVEFSSSDGSVSAFGNTNTKDAVADFKDMLDKRLNLPD